MCGPDVFLAVLAVLFPPVAVWIKVGICSADSLINIALCCLGYIPGLLHAWYIILKYPETEDDYEPLPGGSNRRGDPEGGRVTYYYVAHQAAPPPQQQRSYGTNDAPQQNPPPVNNATRPAHGGNADGGEGQGSSSHPPPTYADAVKGDYKIQTQD